MPIRDAQLADLDAIKALAVAAEMFPEDAVGWVDEMLPGALSGALEGHAWLVHTDAAGQLEGAVYYAPEPFADRVWNVYFIAVQPKTQGRGVGSGLLAAVEAALRERGPEAARVVVIETSSTAKYARTRAFYPARGYVEEARIREYYGPGDDKVIFWKSLV